MGGHHPGNALKLNQEIRHLVLNIFQRNPFLVNQRPVQINLRRIVVQHPVPLSVNQIQKRFQQGNRLENTEITGRQTHLAQFLGQQLPRLGKSEKHRIIAGSDTLVQLRQKPLDFQIQPHDNILKLPVVHAEIPVHVIQARKIQRQQIGVVVHAQTLMLHQFHGKVRHQRIHVRSRFQNPVSIILPLGLRKIIVKTAAQSYPALQSHGKEIAPFIVQRHPPPADKKITPCSGIVLRKPAGQRIRIITGRDPFPRMLAQPQSQVGATSAAEHRLLPVYPHAIHLGKRIVHLHDASQSHGLQTVRSKPGAFLPQQNRLAVRHIVLPSVSQPVIPLMSHNAVLRRQKPRVNGSLVRTGLGVQIMVIRHDLFPLRKQSFKTAFRQIVFINHQPFRIKMADRYPHHQTAFILSSKQPDAQ